MQALDPLEMTSCDLYSLNFLFTNTLVSGNLHYMYLPTMVIVKLLNNLLLLRVLWPKGRWWENPAAILLWSTKQPVNKTLTMFMFLSQQAKQQPIQRRQIEHIGGKVKSNSVKCYSRWFPWILVWSNMTDQNNNSPCHLPYISFNRHLEIFGKNFVF